MITSLFVVHRESSSPVETCIDCVRAHSASVPEFESPKELVTDGLKSYHSAYLEVFVPSGTIHTREIQIKEVVHNNKMERMNGETRDREKVMRGLKNMDTPILKGYQLFHNYIRPHEGLQGKTPAEAAGISVEGANKWITLIQNASRKG
jgi:putative transposase